MKPSTAPTPPRRRRLASLLFAGVVAAGFLPLPPSLLPTAGVARAAADETEQIPEKVEIAVDKALDWLAKNQGKAGEDGSGDPNGYRRGGWDNGRVSSTAVTALALKAFLSRGHVPGQGPYGKNLEAAIDYLLSQQQDDGLMSKGNGNAVMYEHGIAAAVLGETFGMVDDRRKELIGKAMAKSAKLMLDAQKVRKDANNAGGWRYSRTAPDSDISVTGWQLMALRSAANCGAQVPKSALDAGREYVRRCFKPGRGEADPGGFTYLAAQGSPNAARTGTAIVSLEMLGDHHSKEALEGGQYLLKNPVRNPNEAHFYYSVYYVSQALYHLGGKYWSEGYPGLRDSLLANQGPNGTWPEGSGQEKEVGEAYRTSMAVLALCVPYRYLPLFQK